MQEVQTEVSKNKIQVEDEEPTREREIQLQRYLNTLPAIERKRRGLMRRFAGPFCYHPKTLQSRGRKN